MLSIGRQASMIGIATIYLVGDQLPPTASIIIILPLLPSSSHSSKTTPNSQSQSSRLKCKLHSRKLSTGTAWQLSLLLTAPPHNTTKHQHHQHLSSGIKYAANFSSCWPFALSSGSRRGRCGPPPFTVSSSNHGFLFDLLIYNAAGSLQPPPPPPRSTLPPPDFTSCKIICIFLMLSLCCCFF